ncbi:putative ribonuclease H-like domain-containing protein [Tanacetum coccineum]
MRPFGCHVTILNTLDHLGKFDGKSNDGFFVWYSLTNKAFRVYNIRTRKVEENLYIRFLEDKPIVLGNGPKWLFDIDSLTKSMNYVSIIAGTNSNDFVGSEVSIGEATTSKETNTSQDYIDDEGVSKASGVDDQEIPERSTPNINATGPSINIASINLRTGSLHINTISPTVLTTRSNRPQTVLDIFSLRDNVTPEAINADLFGDETEMDMSNLNASYQVLTTLNTRIHKDHSLDHVISNIQSGVQTRGMIKSANEQGFSVLLMKRKPQYLSIEEEVYACQSPRFEDPNYPDKGYNVVKMSSMGKLTFFLGLQVKQKEDGIFISQDKYVTGILKKFGFQDVRTTSTPMDIEKPLLKDSDDDDVDVHLYRSMIGSLVYLTSSRLDIMFACKKQTVVATSSTEAEYMAATSCCGQDKQIEYLMLNALPLKHVKRGRDTKILQSSGPPVKVGDEVVHKELGDKMERAATTASRLEVEQDSDAQTWFEAASKQSNNPPLSSVNTFRSGEDSMKLMELLGHCIKLSELVRKRKERYNEMKNR